MKRFDLDVLQMRLNGIAEMMQDTLFRTAVSPVVREGSDAASALLTVRGEVMAFSNAIPLLLGALPGACRAILDAYPAETVKHGDLFWMNDPFSGGTHLPDITVMMPVFTQDQLVAFAATILHHQDVGGLRSGSVPPDATEIFQEGLRLPPMRLGSGAAMSASSVRLIKANSRVPETVLGDLGAQVAAAIRAERAVSRITAERGATTFLEAVDACLDRAEAEADAAISTLPAGDHFGEDGLDPTPGLPDVTIKVRLNPSGGRLLADFTGSSAQVKAPINCARSGPLSAVLYALFTLTGPNALRNGGTLRRIQLKLPDASVVNAASPAAVNARMGMVRAITSAVLQALAKAAPDRMPAANSGMSYVLAFSGKGPDDAPFLATEIIAGGAGGGPEHDGLAGISTDVGNAMNMPAEALEAMAPIRVHMSGIRHGSGGAGQYRGGDGICRVYEALADGIAVSLRGERFARVPDGLAGGGAPLPSQASIVRADGTRTTLSARSALTLNTGDRLIVESCGGAGHGRPETP